MDFVNRHPDHVLVVLAGTGHARKGSIPMQIEKRSKVPYTVILPEVPGADKAGRDLAQETDLLMITG